MYSSQNQAQQPQYQTKNNKKFFVIIGAALLAIAIIVIVVVFLLRGSEVEVHRQVLFKGGIWETMAIDSEARVLYIAQTGLPSSINKLNDDEVFKKADGSETCTKEAIDEEMEKPSLETFLAMFLPPAQFEQDGSKTVGGTKCDIVKATVNLGGDSHELQWCIADGFVLEVYDDTGEDPIVLTDHEKLSKDSKYFNEDEYCESVGPDFVVHRQVLFKSVFADAMALDNEARVMYVSMYESFPEWGSVIYKLDEGKIFEKPYENETCREGVIDTLTEQNLDRMITILFPPEEFEQDGSKTVNGTKCDIVKAFLDIDGESRLAEWCIADGFVLELVDGTAGESIVLTDHVKLTGDATYFDESQYCDNIEPAEVVVKTSSPMVNPFASRFLKKN
ncbi:hypothetical protein GEMRC1_007323 [Eukaryota sp. GEM-RC1]